MLPVVWLPEADADLTEARAWYDRVNSDLGDRFALAVETTVEAIALHPLQFPVVHRGRRRAGVRRFPYGIVFDVQERRVLVIACFHGARNPKRWPLRQSQFASFYSTLATVFPLPCGGEAAH